MNFKIKNNLTVSIVLMISIVAPLGWTKDDFNTTLARDIIRISKSASINNYLNTEIDPCSDFYKFSCGKWKQINPAESTGVFSTDNYSKLSNSIEAKLKILLSREKTANETITNKIKDFYQSCRNTKTDKKQYRSALQNVYRDFGQFSFLQTEEQLAKHDFQWWSTIAEIQNIYGKSIIIGVDILDDVKNNSRIMLYLGTPSFDMTQSAVNPMAKMQVDKIKIHLQLIFGIADKEASKIAHELMEFEYSLSAGASDVREGKSVEDLLTLYNTTDLRRAYIDLFDVEQFLQIALGTHNLPEQVYVYDEKYLEKLIDVFNSTNERIVENYILWLLLQEYIADAEDQHIDAVCIEKSKKYFGQFIDHAIYNQYRTKEREADIYELWDDIKSQFRDNLKNTNYNWMSTTTREYAIEKLNNMNLTINSYDNNNFIEFFKNLDIDPTNYVVNLENILKHEEALRENKLQKKPESIEDAQTTSYTPVYHIFANEIKIPIALLQPFHIWDANYPKAIKYATFGFLIAHEMIHGFDDVGRNYDANGNARSWWDAESTNAFELQRQCFQAQYRNYIYDGHPLPDSVLQTENIADNAGLKLAYSAYLRWVAKQKQVASDVEASETLPHSEYNNRKLFFISFAQVWCEDTHSDYKSSLANIDIHAPAKYRVIGSLSNMPEFAWVWKCKNESAMTSKNKCEIY